MTIKSTIIALAAAIALQGASAQDNMFRLSFRATCRVLGSNGSLDTTRLTERDIIAAATGMSNGASKQFTLVYNASTDRIQVTDTNGNVITDVILFQGGASTSDGKRSARQTFMFVPNQTNAIGSAIINERAPSSQNGTNRAQINGIVQFALTDDITLGQVSVTGTNGLGTAGTNGVSAIAPFAPAVTTNMLGLTNGFSSTNIVDNTNSVSETNSIGGTNNAGGTNIVTGINGTASGPGNVSNSGFFFSNGFLLQSNGLSNVRICVGTFTTSRRVFENGVVTGVTTNNVNGNATNNIVVTTTNGVSTITTNGTLTNGVVLTVGTNAVSSIRP